jgi:hypothetical protein
VRVRAERAACFVEPGFGGAVAQLLPHRGRIPVVVFLRNEVAALDDQDLRAGRRQLARDGAAAGAAPDDHNVVRMAHCSDA